MKKLLLILVVSASASCFGAPGKPMLMWIDATDNFKRFSSADSIAFYLDKLKSLGFTDVVVDVKPITGEVLYPSRYAPIMREWDGFRRPRTFDYITTFITEAHTRSLRIHAGVNIFVGGQNRLDRGVVFSLRPGWATTIYTDSGMVSIMKLKKRLVAMINPADTSVQNHQLNILRELVSRYPFDGVVLDRVRFDDLHADFSPLSQWLFELAIGKKIEKYPADIFTWEKAPDGSTHSKPGKYFIRWIEWRASIIHDFIAKARAVVKKARPAISFGDYTGSWYPIYFQVGANWASSTYDPSKEYRWASPTYKSTGYAELLDFSITGNYYYPVTKDELAWAIDQIKTVFR